MATQGTFPVKNGNGKNGNGHTNGSGDQYNNMDTNNNEVELKLPCRQFYLFLTENYF